MAVADRVLLFSGARATRSWPRATPGQLGHGPATTRGCGRSSTASRPTRRRATQRRRDRTRAPTSNHETSRESSSADASNGARYFKLGAVRPGRRGADRDRPSSCSGAGGAVPADDRRPRRWCTSRSTAWTWGRPSSSAACRSGKVTEHHLRLGQVQGGVQRPDGRRPCRRPGGGPPVRVGRDIRGILIEMELNERAFPNESEERDQGRPGHAS